MLPVPTTQRGRIGLDAIVAEPAHTLIAFDYDGTLSPIVEDPSVARPQPGIVERLADLSHVVGAVAIVTGRPAQTAVNLGGFAGTPGLDRLVVLGQYGVERWDASSGELQTVDPPPGVEAVRQRLPALLDSLDLGDANVEDKGLALVVHVRRLPRPAEAMDRLIGPLADLAESAGLVTEPGRNVVELRPPGADKGLALRGLVDELGPRSVMFVGDDLGDLAAFDEVERLRSAGVASGVLVCSGSDEVIELAARADLVVDGPPGVSHLISELIEAMGRR